MSKSQHYILFDSGCAQCTDVAAEIEKATGNNLMGKSLYAPEAKQWLDRALPGWKFEPTLVEVNGDKVRAFTGMSMRAQMVTFLNPLQLLKLVRVLQKAGIPLFSSFDEREMDPELAAQVAAETETETPAAHEPAPQDGDALTGFSYTKDGPELGTLTPVAELTTTAGNAISLTSARERNLILLFLSTTCGFCRKVAEDLNRFAQDAPEDLVLVFSVNDPEKLSAFANEFQLTELPFVISPEARSAYGVTGVPYGYALDMQGVIRGKGIVNNEDHLDSLANTFYVSVDAFKQALDSRKEDRVVVS